MRIAALDKEITAKDRQATMRDANQVTRIVAKITAPFSPIVPTEVTLLDYEGRELELWAEAEDAAKLQSTATEMRQTWDKLRPQVESRGGNALATKFGDLVQQVNSPQTPA